jgi:DNA-binding beta-propeller fold protein YncE
MEHYFRGMWGTYGTGDGQFNWPSALSIDSNGNVYVADTNNQRIQKFTDKGIFLDKWGSHGNGEGEFYTPFDIAVDSNDDIYVLDT